MVRLTIVDQDGKTVLLTEVATAMELVALADQARKVIRDCEQLARELNVSGTGPGTGKVPYCS